MITLNYEVHIMQMFDCTMDPINEDTYKAGYIAQDTYVQQL